ncbi:membrane protein [Bacteroidia bacterium]|nr:membrane protein [Bacteroidia bacterium]
MPKKRLLYLLLTVFLFGIETLIALFIHDHFIRPYMGDVLVVILVYCFVRIFVPAGCRYLPLYVFVFACLIEYLQYLNIVERLGLSGNAVARTVLGTSFDWQDILCYGVGCLLAASWQVKNKRVRK